MQHYLWAGCSFPYLLAMIKAAGVERMRPFLWRGSEVEGHLGLLQNDDKSLFAFLQTARKTAGTIGAPSRGPALPALTLHHEYKQLIHPPPQFQCPVHLEVHATDVLFRPISPDRYSSP